MKLAFGAWNLMVLWVRTVMVLEFGFEALLSSLPKSQVKGEYQAKHPWMRAYRNVVLDILRMFPEYTLTTIPRTQNIIADSLATTANNLKIPMNSNNKFEIHVKHRLAIPDNLRGLIPLEEIFYQDDVARKPTLVPTDKGVEDVNIGTTNKPKFVKLSKALPPEVKAKYVRLIYEFPDVFSWDYSDLKVYDKDIIQHTIPIKLDQEPFRQKLRRINPRLHPSIEKEVNRLFKVGIIVLIRFCDWISHLVPVRKKTGGIRLCIDFWNLNKVSLKDNYPLPKMDHILQRVVGASWMSLLDGYLGYNHILVHEKGEDKNALTTPWGTFQYAKMPFGLNNAGATFQQEMDIAFPNEKDVFLVVYLDDLTVFSGSDDEHLHYLIIVFQKCRKFEISLNPKKSIFSMDEGKILGHIISKDGIRIDPSRVEAI
eukprot:PITA_36212